MARPKENQDSTGIVFARRLLRGEGGIPVPPKTPHPQPKPPAGGRGSGSGGSGSGSSSGGSGSGTGGKSSSANTYQQYLNQQKAEQRKAQNKAARRYVADAEALRGQARALKQLLGLGPKPSKKELKKHPGRELTLMDERNTKLGNQRRAYNQLDQLLTDQYGERFGVLEQSATDNERAADSQTVAALSNRQRERANALSEISLQGGGESDLLQAQAMALRNYQANQQEVNRNYRDSLSSINASITDLNADTKTARLNGLAQYNSDREQIWANFYDAKSEAETQLGNTYGQMAEYYGLANEQVGRKKYRRKQKRLTRSSDHAFMDAAHTAAQAWQPPTDTKISTWQGVDDIESSLNNNVFANTGTELKRPEGASLRRWDA